MPAHAGSVALSVVAPAHDEETNLRPLVAEIVRALDGLDGLAGLEDLDGLDGRDTVAGSYEIIIVDDGSTDRTADVLRELSREYPQLRGIRMRGTPRDRGHGQSAALHAAFRAARGNLFVVLDADLQNDPADIPGMIARLRETGADMVQGDRSRVRKDNLMRRVSSRVARLTRILLLGDTIRDTGCSLRVLRREVALALPLEFRGLHRFMPLMTRQLGFTVVEMPVHHRPRIAGITSYGIWNRALPAFVDCFAVRWMNSRRQPVAADPIARPAEGLGETSPNPAATIEIVPVDVVREVAS